MSVVCIFFRLCGMTTEYTHNHPKNTKNSKYALLYQRLELYTHFVENLVLFSLMKVISFCIFDKSCE